MSKEIKEVEVCFDCSEYPDYERREKAKKLYREAEAKPDMSNAQKANYLLHLQVWSHYWRAREAIEDCPRPATVLRKIRGRKYHSGYTLDIDHYTEHWLWAVGEDYPPEIIKEVENTWHYKPIKNRYMRKDEVYYYISLLGPDSICGLPSADSG